MKIRFFQVFSLAFEINTPQTMPLLVPLKMIWSAPDNDQLACGVFIDLQKAFDTVYHKTLLSKMNHCEIKGIPYEWFKSYLTNRQQFTTVNNKQSEL